MSTLAEIVAGKETDKTSRHAAYIPVYEELFGALRQEEITLLELGVDKGGSALMWLEYFPLAHIHGVDNNEQCKDTVSSDRFLFHLCDQMDASYLQSHFPPSSLDIIIDDARHFRETQAVTQYILWHSLKPGGLYCIEDVRMPMIAGAYWRECCPTRREYKVETFDFRERTGIGDDAIILLRKVRG